MMSAFPQKHLASFFVNVQMHPLYNTVFQDNLNMTKCLRLNDMTGTIKALRGRAQDRRR